MKSHIVVGRLEDQQQQGWTAESKGNDQYTSLRHIIARPPEITGYPASTSTSPSSSLIQKDHSAYGLTTFLFLCFSSIDFFAGFRLGAMVLHRKHHPYPWVLLHLHPIPIRARLHRIVFSLGIDTILAPFTPPTHSDVLSNFDKIPRRTNRATN